MTKTRVVHTPDSYQEYGEGAVTVEFYHGNMVNLERLTLQDAIELYLQLHYFIQENQS